MNSMTIRQATILDLAALQAIGRKTFAETFSEGNTEADMAAYLEEGFSEEKLSAEIQLPNSLFYFAENGDELLGYLKVNFGDAQTENQDPKALEIERIYVLQQFQGMSVGQKLFDHAYSMALARNAPYLWLGVWEKNLRAIRFYQKQGFVAFDQHIFQLGDDAQRDLLMKLIIA
jgi:ribosomal protein S18 acetylase RimI-like enzyme